MGSGLAAILKRGTQTRFMSSGTSNASVCVFGVGAVAIHMLP